MISSEVICRFMEPMPNDSPGALEERGEESHWWVDHEEKGGEWQPRALDLGALWEVEQKLIQGHHGVYLDRAYKTGQGYEFYLWHLTVEQKQSALAKVIREIKC